MSRALSDHCVLSVRYPCVIRALTVPYPCLNRPSADYLFADKTVAIYFVKRQFFVQAMLVFGLLALLVSVSATLPFQSVTSRGCFAYKYSGAR